MDLIDRLKYFSKWTIRKYADDQAFNEDRPFEVSEFDGNLLLNEGIGELLDIGCGLGSPTAFSNAAAYLGVGDSSTAESASQTGLQAATNKLYKAMQASYPQRSSQTVTWRAVFASSDANFSWNEFTVANGSSDSAKNLNRKVSAQGTKASGQTWTLDLSITLS
jgi:hypothetical protein